MRRVLQQNVIYEAVPHRVCTSFGTFSVLWTLDISIYSEHSFSVSVFPCFSDLDLDFCVSVFVCSDLVFGFQEFLPGIYSFSRVDLGGVFWFRILSHSFRFSSLSFLSTSFLRALFIYNY